MEESNKIGAQIYGYAVCLVSVVTFLMAITAFVNALIDRSDPLHANGMPSGAPSLASYESYRMDMLRSLPQGDGAKASYIPDDATMQKLYETARTEKIYQGLAQSNRSMTISGMLIVICIILFVVHWHWMRKISIATS
jgi:hypothetical protein